MSVASTNSSDEETNDLHKAQLEVVMMITYKFIVPILVTIAIFTNLVNILLLHKARTKGGGPALAATYRYLTWLAVIDLMAAVSIIPALMHSERGQLSYAWAFYYAHLEIPVMNGLTSAGVYIVVGLSVDRYVAVCHPCRYLDVSAPRTAAFRVALSVIVPALLYLPHCFLYQKVVCATSGRGWTYQGVEKLGKAWEAWNILVELCHRLAPALLLFFLNTFIICALTRLAAQRRSLQGKTAGARQNSAASHDGVRRQQERRLIHLLLAIVTCFLLTNLPSAILAMIDKAGHTYQSLSHEVFRAVANSLEVLGFSLNFFLYFTMMPGVKEAAREVGRMCGLVVREGGRGAAGCSFSERTKSTEAIEL